jgi:arginyl-tRNA synthetase
MLQDWEAGDESVVTLWKQMNAWVIEGFNASYASMGIEFDKVYLESEQYLFGKEIILSGLEKGVFYRRDDGAIECDLTEEKLDRKVVLRSDGTSVYITQDIGTTVNKAKDFGLSGQVFVVGNEQIYHFQVLFSILGKLGYDWADNLTHLAYGMVNLPDGKMKSREGNVVDADDIVAEVAELAAREIRLREPELDPEELTTRSQLIGLAALKFMILSVQPMTGMMYDPKKSVQFDGDTGPYVLYAYARIQRMLMKSGSDFKGTDIDFSVLVDDHEIALALRILAYPGCVQRAARDSNPAIIATFLLQLARSYHSMNRAVLILKAEDEVVRHARLSLSQATATTISNGLGLLGITPVDRM